MRCIALGLLVGAIACGHGAAADDRWYPDVETGLAQAQARHAPGVVVNVAADWCGPCKELEHELDTPTMRQALAGWIRVRVDVTRDTPEADAFLTRWSAGTPTVLFLAPDGTVRARVEKYVAADRLAAMVPR